MKYRLISKHGDALALLYKLSEEGNQADFWVRDAKAKPGYKGILPQVANWNNKLTKDTVILFDMVGLGSIADNLKKNGYKVYGGGKINDSLELNREFGMKIAKSCGIKVPKWKRFDSFDSARKFTKDNQGVWVFKPQDNKSPAFTYVSIDTMDMLEMLDYFEDTWKGKIDFILQEKLDGIEISIEKFYIDGDPIDNTLNSTLECKKFLEGDKGVNTGCMGSVVWFWKKSEPKLYRYTLKKVEPFLKKFKYTGPLDCNCIISEKDKMPYFLEWTARFGYNALYALCEGINQEIGDYLSDIMNSEPVERPSYDWLGAVRITIPPYPLNGEDSANKPVRGVEDEHVWLLDAKYEKNRLLTAGVDGVVCEVSGRHQTLSGLSDGIYSIVDNLKIPDMQYRRDIVRSAESRLETLKSKEWRYF